MTKPKPIEGQQKKTAREIIEERYTGKELTPENIYVGTFIAGVLSHRARVWGRICLIPIAIHEAIVLAEYIQKKRWHCINNGNGNWAPR